MSDDRSAIPAGTVLEGVVLEGRYEVAQIRGNLPDRNLHPTWYALVTEYCRRREVVLDELAAGRDPSADALAAMLELRSWVMADEDRPGEFASSLARYGMSATEAEAVLDRATDKKPGRPVSRRQAFVNSYEMQQRGASYRQIATATCNCERMEHNKYCVEAVRQGIQSVRKLLEKYQLLAP